MQSEREKGRKMGGGERKRKSELPRHMEDGWVKLRFNSQLWNGKLGRCVGFFFSFSLSVLFEYVSAFGENPLSTPI